MTIKQTLQAIKALPNMTATYNSEYKEYKVRRLSMHSASPYDYFTTDAQDALGTAKKMSDWTALECEQ